MPEYVHIRHFLPCMAGLEDGASCNISTIANRLIYSDNARLSCIIRLTFPAGLPPRPSPQPALDKYPPICHPFQDSRRGVAKMGVLLRWLGAFVLLAAIFNPTSWNYVAWARASWGQQTPLIVFTGLILAVVAMVYLVATLRSIGILGAIIIAAIFAAGLWVLTDWGVLGLDNSALNTWLALLVLSLILGIGMSWSILRQRLSGQQTTDEVDS